jgi:hypothetical protein
MGATMRRTPISLSAQTLARYGILCGGISSSAPRRGRKATVLPPTSVRPTGADGLPYGVSSSMLSASSKGAE